MMDGGRGQVNIALEVLEKLHLHIPVCGMVKDDNHRTRGLYFNNTELPIDRNSECFPADYQDTGRSAPFCNYISQTIAQQGDRCILCWTIFRESALQEEKI